MPNTTEQPNESAQTPTGDQIMSAARDAIAAEFPNAPQTASDHANHVFNTLVQMLKENEQL